MKKFMTEYFPRYLLYFNIFADDTMTRENLFDEFNLDQIIKR